MALDEIPFIDHPELKIDEHESTEMPFRYVRDSSGNPVMPKVSHAQTAVDFIVYGKAYSMIHKLTHPQCLKGMMELIKQDSEKGFGDLL